MDQPFWEHYPKRAWVEADWESWEKAGRPRVPREMDLQPPPEREVGNSAVIPPPGPQSAVTTLFPRPRRREVGAQSRAVDALLAKHVGRVAKRSAVDRPVTRSERIVRHFGRVVDIR